MSEPFAAPPPSEIGRTARQGVAWFMTTGGITQAIQFGVGVALARLLDPTDFGTYGIALIFMGLASTLSQFGLGSAIVQRKEITEEHVATMWLANLAINGLLCLLLVALSPLVARFFANQSSGAILRLISLNFVLNALPSVSFTLMERNLRFSHISTLTLASDLGNHVVSLGLAVLGYGVWSLAWGRMTAVTIRCVGAHILEWWRPRLRFSVRAARELLVFSGPMGLKGIVAQATANVGQIVVGRILGTEALGLYTRARSLVWIPVSKLAEIVWPIAHPTFCRLQDDGARLRLAYRKVVTETTAIALPSMVLAYLAAPSFIPLVYGAKWRGAVEPFQILCVVLLFYIGSTYGGILLDSQGRVWENLNRNVVGFTLLVGGTIAGSWWGLRGICWAVVFASSITVVILQRQVNQAIGATWREYIGCIRPGAVGAAWMLLGVGGLQASMVFLGGLPLESFAILGLTVVAGLATLAGLVYWRREGESGIILREWVGLMRKLVRT